MIRKKIGEQRGFTLIELMIVVAIIGILAAIAIPLYSNMQTRAAVGKAQADVRSLASAISTFQAHTGAFPGTLGALTISASDAAGVAAGPWMAKIPTQPAACVAGGSTAYGYNSAVVATGFSVSATGAPCTVAAAP